MTTETPANPGVRKRLPVTPGAVVIAVAIPVLLFFTLVAWSFGSSVGSSPDDDFHLPSIWCGLGERTDLCEESGDPSTRLVPAPLTDAACFAFRPEVSGSCWDPADPGLVETPRVNVGLYPPLFYAVTSTFATTDVQVSVLAIRIFNSALGVGVLSAVFFALPRRLRPALLISAIGAAVPLGMSVLASTNPSAWAYISAATVWITLYGSAVSRGRRRWVLAALAVFGAVLGAGARADAAAYAVLAVTIAAVLGARWGRALVPPAVAATAIGLASMAFYISSGQSAAMVTGLTPGDPPPPLSIDQQIENFLGIPALLTGALGGWGLGWLDTGMPAVVSALSLAVASGVLFIGSRSFTRRRAAALVLALAALYLVPFALLAQSNAVIGAQVQPRYVLPLIVIALGVASVGPRTAAMWRGPRVVLASVALTVAMTVALHVNIRRYTTGLDDRAISLGARAEWWWEGLPSPTLVWAGGSLAFAAALILIAVVLHRPRPRLDSARDPSSA